MKKPQTSKPSHFKGRFLFCLLLSNLNKTNKISQISLYRCDTHIKFFGFLFSVSNTFKKSIDKSISICGLIFQASHKQDFCSNKYCRNRSHLPCPFGTDVLRQLLQKEKAGTECFCIKYNTYHLPACKFWTSSPHPPYSFFPLLPSLFSLSGSQAMTDSVSLCYSCIMSPAYIQNPTAKFITQKLAVVAQQHKVTLTKLSFPPSQCRWSVQVSSCLYSSQTITKKQIRKEEKDSLALNQGWPRFLRLLFGPFYEFEHHVWDGKLTLQNRRIV